MESLFSHDFSKVRVHADASASRAARSIGALAYTSGEHVVFDQDFYRPSDWQGQRLLAHELAHVVQQRRGHPMPQASSRADGSPSHWEAEADAAADAVARGEPVPPLTPTNAGLQCQEAPGHAYNLRLTYPPHHTESHQAVPLTEALRILRAFASRIDAHVAGRIEGHRFLVQLHQDQRVVATISDIFGGTSLPSMGIWEPPQRALQDAQAHIASGDVRAAASRLQLATSLTRAAERIVYEYREGTISGAEVAVFGLEVVQVASSAAIAVGTGGTAGVLLGAGYAGAQRLAGEAMAVHLDLQTQIDWTGVAFDTLFSAAAGRFGGQLARGIAARLGGRLAAQALASLLTARAAGILHAVSREVFDAARGRTTMTVEGFIDRVAEQLTLRAVFLDMVTVAAGGVATPKVQLPPSRPATVAGPPQLRVLPSGNQTSLQQRGSRVGGTSGSAGSFTSGTSRASTATALAREFAPLEAPVKTRHLAAVPDAATVPQATSPATSLPQPTSGPGTAAAIVASGGPASQPGNQAMQVILDLPGEKAIHAPLYASLIAERRLSHVPLAPRHTAQAANWDRALRPGGAMGMDERYWQLFDDLDIVVARRLRPNWTRAVAEQSAMGVDHRVEWQLLDAANRTWADTMMNYELLDAGANSRAGSTLRGNIARERTRLAALHGPQMATARIVFTTLRVQSAVPADRWLPEEVQMGEHYHALRQHLRQRGG